MASNKVISKLSVIVGVNSGEMQTGLAMASGRVRTFGSEVSGSAKSVGTLDGALASTGRTFQSFTRFLSSAALQLGGFIVASAGAAASVGGLIESFGRIDSVAKLADQLGFTTQEIQAFQYGANLAGTDLGELERGLQRFTLRLGQAREGSSEGLKGFEKLGLDVQRLLDMRPAQAFAEVAEAIKQLGTPAEQAAAAYELFGRSGQNLLTFLNSGKDGIAAFTAEAENLGLTFDRDMAARVEQANDAITSMGTAVQGLTDQLAISLAPAVTMAAQTLQGFVLWLGATDASTVKSTLQIGTLVTTIGLVITIGPRVISAIRAIILTLRALAVGSTLARAAAGDVVGVLAAVAIGGAAAIGVGLAFDKMTKGVEGAAAAAKKLAPAITPGEDLPGPQEIDPLAESIAKAKRETEEWARIGERLTDRFKTPMESATDAIEEASEALRRGVISWETYERAVSEAIAAAEKEHEVATRPRVAVGAAVRGTSQGQSMIDQSIADRQAFKESMKKSGEADFKRNMLLDLIHKKLADIERKGGPVTVKENRI